MLAKTQRYPDQARPDQTKPGIAVQLSHNNSKNNNNNNESAVKVLWKKR